MNKGFNEKNGGITLIALVVTMVVLLILAGVSLNAVIGNSGIINRTQEASKETDIAETREQILMELMGIYAGSGDYTNDDVITAVKTVTGEEIEEGTETVITAKGNEVAISDLWKIIAKVGDYVNYTPDTGKYTVASGNTGSGYTSDQSYTTETLAWRILSIDESTGKIELVSETAGSTLYLTGANGYNHAVDILNDLCETLYSKTVNGTKVATGRSINVEDINAKTTYSPIGEKNTSTGFTYLDTKQLSTYGTGYMKYPNIYSQEIGYGTAGTFNNTGLDGEQGLKDGVTDENGVTTYSTVTGYTDGKAEGTDPYVTHTYYGYNGSSYTYYPDQCLNADLGINTAPTGLINIGTSYYLASRCVFALSPGANFSVCFLGSSGYVSIRNLFYSNGNATIGSYDYAVRPVVSLSSSVKLTIDTENSTDSVTYWNIEF